MTAAATPTTTNTAAADAATVIDGGAGPDADIAAHRAEFDRLYASLLRRLELEGLQPKTVEAYSRGIRRMGEHFRSRLRAI